MLSRLLLILFVATSVSAQVPATHADPAPSTRIVSAPTKQPAADLYAPAKSRMILIVGLFIGLAVLRVWLAKSRRGNHAKAAPVFPPPTRKPQGGLAPLVIPRRNKSATGAGEKDEG